MNCKRCGKSVEDHAAGRETDACVAEVVMGRKIQYVRSDPGAVFGGAVFTADRRWIVDDWFDIDMRRRVDGYSTRGASIEPLLDRLRELGMGCEMRMYPKPLEGSQELYFATAWRTGRSRWVPYSEANTLALAICRAALEAMSLIDAEKTK